MPRASRAKAGLGGANPTQMYLVTYLARITCSSYTMYDAKGHLLGVQQRTRLIERDCVILAQNLQLALREIEETDHDFVRLLKSQMVPANTVVHILDRATNVSEKV